MKLFYANTKVNTDVKYENVISSVSDHKTVFYAFNSTYQSGKKNNLIFNIHCTGKDRNKEQILPKLISTV